jgi:hypothetical protein
MCARETLITHGRSKPAGHKTQKWPHIPPVAHQRVLRTQEDDSNLFTFVEEFQGTPDKAFVDWQDEYMDLT